MIDVQVKYPRRDGRPRGHPICQCVGLCYVTDVSTQRSQTHAHDLTRPTLFVVDSGQGVIGLRLVSSITGSADRHCRSVRLRVNASELLHGA